MSKLALAVLVAVNTATFFGSLTAVSVALSQPFATMV